MSDISLTSVPLEDVILDHRNEEELLSQAKVRVLNESGGLLNDFTENSPVAALIQGQVHAGAELLYDANRQTLKLLIEFLKRTGVERSLGTKAVVTLTFTLTSPQPIAFGIPEGFEVVDSSGQY